MNEYISRKAVYQFAKDLREKETGAFSKGYNKGLRVMMAAAMNKDAIPSEDVLPARHGEWKLNRDGSITCSECKRKQLSCVDNWDMDNFCHFCGADMRG